MNTAEIKLDLMHRLDNLDGRTLENVYEQILAIINAAPSPKQQLSTDVKNALDEALQSSRLGNVYSHNEAMQKTKEKYPNLFA
jgi:hypothetical protein